MNVNLGMLTLQNLKNQKVYEEESPVSKILCYTKINYKNKRI